MIALIIAFDCLLDLFVCLLLIILFVLFYLFILFYLFAQVGLEMR